MSSADSHLHIHKASLRHNNKDRRRKTSLTKYLPLTLLRGFEKVIQGLRVRGCWRPNRNCNILTPTLMAVNVVSFSFSRCSTGGPGPLCWVMVFFTASYQQLLCTPTQSGLKAPSAWYSFPYHISSITPSPTLLQLSWLLSWLSYIIVQRPLDRPLDLWNRMFDRHQVEITVMQFTGHSLPVRQSMSVPYGRQLYLLIRR